MTAPGPTRKFLGRLSLPERTYVAEALRAETVGGVLLLTAAIAALIWANTPLGDSYEAVRDFHLGLAALGLDLSVQHWAADGLLAIFFFVAGVELKRELVAGELRDPRAAALPVIAALSGMVAPAIVYLLVNVLGDGSTEGWAVPTATDIAFALAVLAVIGTSLPSALRAFLLTLAVVDDLFAILIIAVFFTSDLNFAALGGAVAGLALFWLLLRKGVRGWYVYVPLALVIWGLMYNSGVHATIAGVAMGLMLRCTRREGEEHSPGERIEHLVRPLSAGLAVPLFALFSAGVVGLRRIDDRRVHPAGDPRCGSRPGRRQDRGHLRRHLARRPFHPGGAQRRSGLAGRVRGRRTRRHRIHRLAPHRRTRLRRRPVHHRRGQGRGADRVR